MYLTSGKNRRLQDEVSGKTSVCNISANFDRRINQDILCIMDFITMT